jgi:hypothetical protein
MIFTSTKNYMPSVSFQVLEVVSSSTNVWKKVCFSSEFSLVKCLCACVIPWIPNMKTHWWQIILSWSKYHYEQTFSVHFLNMYSDDGPGLIILSFGSRNRITESYYFIYTCTRFTIKKCDEYRTWKLTDGR